MFNTKDIVLTELVNAFKVKLKMLIGNKVKKLNNEFVDKYEGKVSGKIKIRRF